MRVSYANFKKDKFFFLKYFFNQMSWSLIILALLLVVKGIHFSGFEFQTWQIIPAIIAVLFGIQVPAVLHNAVHHNIKPRWLNELIGEVAGYFVLFGLGPFRISHVLHHAHADSEFDPHPPNGKGFLYFLATTQLNTIRVIRRRFLNIHGSSAKTHSVLALEIFFYYISLVARLVSWVLLLEPTYFMVFFVPAYLTNVLVFAHINFATHKTHADGRVEIINLNHNFYYKLVNRIGSGVYFHKNHHLKPGLYNPSAMETAHSRVFDHGVILVN